MSSAEEKQQFGKFENTVILPLDETTEPIQLSSIKETIDWVKNNDIASVDCVIPMFRTEDGWVISPQLNVRGFAMTISALEQK